RVNKPGEGYTLVARSGIVTSAASDPFTEYAATHFKLVRTSTAQAGTSFTVTVTAVDDLNHVDRTYRGTVHFSSTASPLAVLPGDYTFTSTDNGTHTLTVTLNRAGVQTLTVADTLTPAVKSAKDITVAPGALSGFLVSGYPGSTRINVTNSFSVVALDDFGNTVKSYRGTVV